LLTLSLQRLAAVLHHRTLRARPRFAASAAFPWGSSTKLTCGAKRRNAGFRMVK